MLGSSHFSHTPEGKQKISRTHYISWVNLENEEEENKIIFNYNMKK